MVLSMIGFGSGGVIANSLAAAWHSSIGNVATGSTFSMLQSIGATGITAAAGPVIGILGGAAAGIAYYYNS